MTPALTNFSTNGTTGVRELSGLPFLPSAARFTVSQKTSTSEFFVHLSTGFTDGTVQACQAIYWDASGGKTNRFSDRVINHMNRVSGTVTDVVKADGVTFIDNGGGDYRMQINFTATITGYRIDVELYP